MGLSGGAVYKDTPVSGDTRTETTSVKQVDDRTNEIARRGGKLTQVIANVLSQDGKRIEVTTTTAVYETLA
jgi:hypothetical protein